MLETVSVSMTPLPPNWKLKVSWFTHPLTITSFLVLLILVGLMGGNVGYLSIAIIQLFVLILLWRYAPLSGVLWLLSFATVLGFFQRLALYSGRVAGFDYIRFILELGVLFFAIKTFLYWNRDRKQSLQWTDIWVSIYLIWSTLYAFNLFYVTPLVTIYGWRWVCIPIFMYFIGRSVGEQPGALQRINQILIILLLLQAGYGVMQAVLGFPFFEQPWIAQLAARETAWRDIEGSMFIAGKPRIPALTEGHTTGSFLIPYLFLWIFFLPKQFLTQNFRRLRWIALGLALFFFATSNERSSIGMVVVGISTVIFLKWRRKLGRIIFSLMIPVILLFILMVSQIDPSQIPWQQDTIVLRRLAELANPFKSGTLAGRFEVYWPQMWAKFLENPMGYGLGTFHDTTANRASEGSVGFSPHNMYIQIAMEIGLIGILLFFFWLGSYIFLLYKSYQRRKSHWRSSIALSALASFMAFLAIGFANQPIETFALALLFWFLVGLSTTCLITQSLEPVS